MMMLELIWDWSQYNVAACVSKAWIHWKPVSVSAARDSADKNETYLVF
jgi:hypothetical protein